MNHKMSIRRITSNQRKTPACDLASCRGATGLPPMNDCTRTHPPGHPPLENDHLGCVT